MTRAATHEAMTAKAGTRWWFRRVHSRWPGTARSRENAYIMREQLVTQAMPQKSWPMTAIRMITSAQFLFISADVNTEIDVPNA